MGCGVSTALCVAAADFAGYAPKITCVEPYPTPLLKRLSSEGGIRLMECPAQDVDLSALDALSGDLLFFVDSSHTLGPSGEVSRIMLEMLPRLKKRATVHFHDIFFPYDYARNIVKEALFFWHESVLLHSFLAYNERYAILASCSMLHYEKQVELQALLTSYAPAKDDQGLSAGKGHFPSSIYLQGKC